MKLSAAKNSFYFDKFPFQEINGLIVITLAGLILDRVTSEKGEIKSESFLAYAYRQSTSAVTSLEAMAKMGKWKSVKMAFDWYLFEKRSMFIAWEKIAISSFPSHLQVLSQFSSNWNRFAAAWKGFCCGISCCILVCWRSRVWVHFVEELPIDLTLPSTLEPRML